MTRPIAIFDERSKRRALEVIERLALDGKAWEVAVRRQKSKRSLRQNRLQRLWIGQAAEHLGDRTTEEIRADCKLRFGVPILCADDPAFAAKYEKMVRNLSYEEKIEIMSEPFDFPVTRLMSTAQMARYNDAMARYFEGLGVNLFYPQEQGREA